MDLRCPYAMLPCSRPVVRLTRVDAIAGTAIEHWRNELAAWAIPDEVLQTLDGENPWALDPALFAPARPDPTRASEWTPPGLAAQRALEALPEQGSVLDVGCGGGAASIALSEQAGSMVGIDESAAMLEVFSAEAAARGLEHRTVLGRWPDVRATVSPTNVVLCHHVAYNVPDLDEFALALQSAATNRVVIELSPRHPQTRNAAVWQHFWGITRPSGPSAEDALAVLREVGIDATLERDDRVNDLRADRSPEQRAAQVARHCCLGPDRVADVMTFLAQHPPAQTPPVVIWWDV